MKYLIILAILLVTAGCLSAAPSNPPVTTLEITTTMPTEIPTKTPAIATPMPTPVPNTTLSSAQIPEWDSLSDCAKEWIYWANWVQAQDDRLAGVKKCPDEERNVSKILSDSYKDLIKRCNESTRSEFTNLSYKKNNTGDYISCPYKK